VHEGIHIISSILKETDLDPELAVQEDTEPVDNRIWLRKGFLVN
jgi:hypothetical protein